MPPLAKKRIALMGSTGSIGTSTLDVVTASADRLGAHALTAHHQLDLLVEQCQSYQPRWAVAADEERAASFDWSALPKDTELLVGETGLEQVARDPDIDTVVAAIVGSAGLQSTWAALEAGKRVALANKETLVVAGPLVKQLTEQHGSEILPVDSEHSAIFQSLAAGRRWEMGAKISIDSATMMNKALEIIEARWLFDLDPDQISVVVHPQSIVHSMVEYVDGSVVSQMSPPDMRLPIQYALSYPERWESPARKSDFGQPAQLDFYPPDFEKFPAIELGLEVARAGGTAGVVVNAANEAAVAGFLDGRLKFTEIVPACRAVLKQHTFDPRPDLSDLFRLDAWAREEVLRWVCT